MRSPFHMDKLSPSERANVKRSHLRVVGFYAALSLLFAGGMALKMDRFESQLEKFRLGSEAHAASRPGSPLCAERDIKYITLIEDAGEARSVPGERLADAYFTMMKARELCAAGRVADAIAVYDSITIAPVQAAAR